ncbi:MAG: CapA family protein [Lachnospiraceae bacterium]|nr:CapA family protein [Lachnospiraceae bacterium]
MTCMAVIVIITAFVLLWWYGAFIPGWVDWKESRTDIGTGYAVVKDRSLTLYEDDKCEKIFWKSPKDLFVQDILIKDIDMDGKEELIMLVWKHGSFGEHMPFWVKKNDKALKQHIFIYRFDENREDRLRPVWMSSQIDYEIASIASGAKERIIVTDLNGVSNQWMWRDFGLKMAGRSDSCDISLLCAGDNLIHLSLINKTKDLNELYDDIRDDIKLSDIAVLNQETILVDDNGAVSDYPKFGTPITVGEAIVNAGFDVINLANNHALDKGEYGIDTTLEFFESKGIECIGASKCGDYSEKASDRIRYIEKDGIKVAFLGFTYGTNGQPQLEGCPHTIETFDDEKRIIRQLDHARKRADVVVVYAHWGDEYETTVNEQQRKYAGLFCEHGVDIVVGTHPHVIQEYELIKNNDHQTLVFYSLGNLISGQTKSGTKIGGLAKINVHKDADGQITIKDYELKEVKAVR